MTHNPPPRPKTKFVHVTGCNALQKRLRADYRQLGTWQAVGEKYGVSRGMAFRVATTAYEPHKPTIRAALGLPVMKPAPVCECGEVHVSKRCPNKPRPPAKPRTKWKQVAGWAFLVALMDRKQSAS